jgi:hypothetical protein
MERNAKALPEPNQAVAEAVQSLQWDVEQKLAQIRPQEQWLPLWRQRLLPSHDPHPALT